MLDKQVLRKHIKLLTGALSTETRQTLSQRVLEKLETHPKFQAAQTVMLFYSLPDEVGTHEFVARWAAKKRILLPAVKGEDIEVRRLMPSAPITPGAFGIGEPESTAFAELQEIELVVVPGVAFDSHGNRLGRGRGYYDRFLSQEKLKSAWKIGICFPHQLVESVPTAPGDIAMHEVLC